MLEALCNTETCADCGASITLQDAIDQAEWLEAEGIDTTLGEGPLCGTCARRCRAEGRGGAGVLRSISLAAAEQRPGWHLADGQYLECQTCGYAVEAHQAGGQCVLGGHAMRRAAFEARLAGMVRRHERACC